MPYNKNPSNKNSPLRKGERHRRFPKLDAKKYFTIPPSKHLHLYKGGDEISPSIARRGACFVANSRGRVIKSDVFSIGDDKKEVDQLFTIFINLAYCFSVHIQHIVPTCPIAAVDQIIFYPKAFFFRDSSQNISATKTPHLV